MVGRGKWHTVQRVDFSPNSWSDILSVWQLIDNPPVWKLIWHTIHWQLSWRSTRLWQTTMQSGVTADLTIHLSDSGSDYPFYSRFDDPPVWQPILYTIQPDQTADLTFHPCGSWKTMSLTAELTYHQQAVDRYNTSWQVIWCEHLWQLIWFTTHAITDLTYDTCDSWSDIWNRWQLRGHTDIIWQVIWHMEHVTAERTYGHYVTADWHMAHVTANLIHGHDTWESWSGNRTIESWFDIWDMWIADRTYGTCE